MLDINRIRENPEGVKEALKKKLWDADFTELLEWDKRKKELIQFVETILWTSDISFLRRSLQGCEVR